MNHQGDMANELERRFRGNFAAENTQNPAATGKLQDGMLKCWSCKSMITYEQRSLNDGHCPKCNCEIQL